MQNKTRRDFLKGAALGAASLAIPAGSAAAAAVPGKRSATDWVTLGNSGVKVTRLAFGTGTYGGRVQRELGQPAFTRLVRHAYDRGIRFFETADSYSGMPQMLAEALRGLPRDSYRLMTKMRLRETDPVNVTIDRFRRELNSEYFDILLLHCVRTPDWPEQFKKFRDEFSEAKSRKIIASHGASCHGLLPLRAFPQTTNWLDVALLRVNHDGTRMDAIPTESSERGNVKEVTSTIQTIRKQGTGVLGMKLIGEGRFTTPEQREMSLRYVMQLGAVDAVTIGYKNTAEIDEAIERIDRALHT